MKQVIDGKDKVTLLKDVAYAPNCRTNLVSLRKARSIGIEVVFNCGGSKMVATYKGKTVMHGDSKETSISELNGIVRMSSGHSNIAFLNAGKDDAMKLAHRRTWHTPVSTFRKTQETNATYGLDKVMSSRNVNNICEDSNAVGKPHL